MFKAIRERLAREIRRGAAKIGGIAWVIDSDEHKAWITGKDLPEAFAGYRDGVGEARHKGFVEDLEFLGMKYVEGEEYNEPAVRSRAGWGRADRQVEKLGRAREILLSTLDRAKRREEQQEKGRGGMMKHLRAFIDALKGERLAWEGIASTEGSTASPPDTEDRLARRLVALAPAQVKRIDAVIANAEFLVLVLEQGTDPDHDYARAMRWCRNIAGEPWNRCAKCGHFLLDHLAAGGCRFPGAVAVEVEAMRDSKTGEHAGECHCGEPGFGERIVPTAEPVPPNAVAKTATGKGAVIAPAASPSE